MPDVTSEVKKDSELCILETKVDDLAYSWGSYTNMIIVMRKESGIRFLIFVYNKYFIITKIRC